MIQSYFYAIGIQLDKLLCAVLTGSLDTTLSLFAARLAAKGNRPACWFCAVLSMLVQRDHCADQLAGTGMPLGSEVRAFIGLAALAAALEWPFIHLLKALVP